MWRIYFKRPPLNVFFDLPQRHSAHCSATKIDKTWWLGATCLQCQNKSICRQMFTPHAKPRQCEHCFYFSLFAKTNLESRYCSFEDGCLQQFWITKSIQGPHPDGKLWLVFGEEIELPRLRVLHRNDRDVEMTAGSQEAAQNADIIGVSKQW